MKDLLDLIVYVFNNYPKAEELSKPRLVKIIYLIDWKHTIDKGHQYTDIKWYFNHYGPYVDDIIYLIKTENTIFNVRSTTTPYGNLSDKISLKEKTVSEIPTYIKHITDFIISNTYKLNWSSFISLIYSTYPIKNNAQYSFLDLGKEATLFKSDSSKLLQHN